MAAPEVDWSFADAPADSEAGEPGPASAPGPSRPPRRWPSRRLMLGLLSVTAVVGLGAWLFTRLGWQRLQEQLAAQIVYEDQRAQAGDLAAVLALQAPSSTPWRDQLAAQVRLGLAAPLPAGDLLPAGTPPRLTRLDALGGDLFAATVTRDYVNSAGQTFSFDLIQRYRNLAPGQWDRLPPDTNALSAATVFQGERLRVTFPSVDRQWLEPALRQADALLVAACGGWGDTCPAGWRLSAIFGNSPDLGIPAMTARPATTAGGYPRVFDLPATAPEADGRFRLATPMLTGRPRGDAAQAAWARSLSVRLLALLAGELTGLARTNQDYFLDALVARAEARYLAAPAAAHALAPQDFIPIDQLWQASYITPDVFQNDTGGWRTDLAARQGVLDYLNLVLAGQPAGADGVLLSHLRGPAGMSADQWLGESPGAMEKFSLPSAWQYVALAGLNVSRPVDWHPYEGLVMACNDAVYRVAGGLPRPVNRQPTPGLATLGIGDVSLDGRFMVVVTAGEPPPGAGLHGYAMTLLVTDLATGANATVDANPLAAILGWSVTGQLVYLVADPVDDPNNPNASFKLMAYDPAIGSAAALVAEPVGSTSFGPNVWSANHSTLAWVAGGPILNGQLQPQLVRYTFGPSARPERLGLTGEQAALSPDGTRVAFVSFTDFVVSESGIVSVTAALDVFDAASGTTRTLAVASSAEVPGMNIFWAPQWSPDGQRLAWNSATLGQIESVAAEGGEIKTWRVDGRQPLRLVGYSPDGRYLLATSYEDSSLIGQGVQNYLSLKQYWLLDQQAQTVQPPSSLWAYSTLWLPDSHRLLAAGPAGVTSFDPATGEYQWLGNWPRCQLRR